MKVDRLVSANTRTFGYDLEVVLEAVGDAGFHGIEVWEEDAATCPLDVRSAVEKANLEISAFQLLRDFEGCGAVLMPEKLVEAEKLMSMMQKAGASTLLMCANTQKTSSGGKTQQISDLKELARMAASRGLRVGFEPLAWSKWIYDYELADACVSAVNESNFGLVLDVFHLFSRGTSIEVVDELDVDKLFLLQLSNVSDLQLPTIEVARHHRRFPSDGIWPVGEVVRNLDRRGYEGYYSLEVFNDSYRKQDPFEVALQGMRSFESIFEHD